VRRKLLGRYSYRELQENNETPFEQRSDEVHLTSICWLPKSSPSKVERPERSRRSPLRFNDFSYLVVKMSCAFFVGCRSGSTRGTGVINERAEWAPNIYASQQPARLGDRDRAGSRVYLPVYLST
jgi:hypothetical protein